MIVAAIAIATVVSLPAPGEHVEFIGFSKNERLAAWKVKQVVPMGDAVDTYSVYRVEDTQTGELLSEYRAGVILRLGSTDRVKSRALQNLHPRWKDALGLKAWKKLSRTSHFRKKRLPMSDSAFRLAADPDCKLRATAEEKTIDVSATIGSALGYHAVGRRMDGPLMSLGYFRIEGSDDQRLAAKVEAYFSPSGYSVAVVNRVTAHRANGDSEVITGTRVIRLQRAPIASVYIGTFNLANENLRISESLYKGLHPAMAKQYDQFVDRRW